MSARRSTSLPGWETATAVGAPSRRQRSLGLVAVAIHQLPDLKAAIEDWIANHNRNPEPLHRDQERKKNRRQLPRALEKPSPTPTQDLSWKSGAAPCRAHWILF